MNRWLGLSVVAVLLVACDGQIGGLADGSDGRSSLSGDPEPLGPDESPRDPTPNEPGDPTPEPGAPGLPPSAPKTPIAPEPAPGAPGTPNAPEVPEEPAREPAPGVTDTFYATRTTCMRPCAVQFDVQAGASLSWSEVRDSEFVWDFDDGGSRRDSEGFLAAVVYEEAGTYQPTVTVDGETLLPQTITVTEPKEVACVSPASDWTNCPAGATKHTSISAAMSATGANSHILLEGNRSHGSLPTSGEDNILFGAYDTGGGNPTVTSPGGSPRRGWAYQDLIIKGSGTLFGATHPNLLWHRVTAPSGQTFVSAVYDVTGVFIVDSDIDGDAYTMFIGSSDCDRLVLKDTRLQSTASGQHVIRIQDCDRVLVQNSSFVAEGPQTAFTVRGNSDWGLIQGNYANRLMSISAKNTTTDSIRTNWIVERNFVDLLPGAPKGIYFTSTQNAVARNNIVHGKGSGAGVLANGGQIRSNANLVIVNNTYYDSVARSSAQAATCHGNNCVAKNNLGIASPSGSSRGCVDDLSGNSDISNNWCYTTANTGWCEDPVDGSTGSGSCFNPKIESFDPASPNFMRPGAGTRGIVIGAQNVPVWNDYRSAERARIDVGAVER